MKIYVVTTFVGCFGVDENNKIISFKPFPKNPEEAADKLNLSKTKIIDAEKLIIEELKNKGYSEFVFPFQKSGVKTVEPDNKAEKYIKQNLREIVAGKKFFKDQIEFNKFLVEVNAELTRAKIRQSTSRDRIIMQTISAIDELDKSLNIFMERLREMYSIYFPEMDRAVANHEKYVKLVVDYGYKDKFEDATMLKLAEKSMGIEFTKEDMEIVQQFARKMIDLYSLKRDLIKYTEETTKSIAPNLSDIAGPMLAARLVSKAGGLERLAKNASSTIQLLGAEKSLFRFLHGKGKSPRFGILATHPLVQNTPERLKGRVARMVASKLSIAAKIDYYSKEYRGEKMKKEMQEKIKKILSSR